MMGRSRRRLGRVHSMLALIAVLVVAGLVAAAPAGAVGAYADPAGDSGSAGDVIGIQVASDSSSGQIVFRITGRAMSTASNQLTFLVIDSDANPLTGSLTGGGVDYLFIVDNESYGFFHWSGSDWVDTSSSTVQISGARDGSALTFSVNRRELGNTSDFNFGVSTVDTNSTTARDDAPNDGMFNYSIEKGGPLINDVALKATPAKPKSGKRIVVAVTGLTLPPDGRTATTPILPESYTCTATLKGRAIRGSGVGGCTFAIPKKSKGKALKVTVTVKYQGGTATKTLTLRVA